MQQRSEPRDGERGAWSVYACATANSSRNVGVVDCELATRVTRLSYEILPKRLKCGTFLCRFEKGTLLNFLPTIMWIVVHFEQIKT
jgi:hypothetical protein